MKICLSLFGVIYGFNSKFSKLEIGIFYFRDVFVQKARVHDAARL